MSEERIEHQLYDIDCTLHKILEALQQLAPQGAERERIALGLYTTLDVEAEASFRHADGWIAERDKQRAQQVEQRRAE